MHKPSPRTERIAPTGRLAGDAGGACGDLGTLLPYAIGAIVLAGMAPAGVLLGFAAALIGSGLFYAIPMAVQPMKAVGALMLAGDLTPAEIAASGMVLGAVMLFLGASGLIGRLSRLVPQTVTAGLQLGLGLAMAFAGLKLMAGAPWLGAATLAAILLLLRLVPVAALPVGLAVAIAAGLLSGATVLPEELHFGGAALTPVLPERDAVAGALVMALPAQLPLTIANAVILTAALARTLYPDAASRASERNLSLTTGIANLALAPFGALPMCHGAGGLQARHRFGARTGRAPVLLGVVLLVLGLALPESAAALLTLIPPAAVGALIVIAGADLALSRRLFDARPDCRPIIAVTALATALVNPAAGLAAGWAIELGRGAGKRLWARLRSLR